MEGEGVRRRICGNVFIFAPVDVAEDGAAAACDGWASSFQFFRQSPRRLRDDFQAADDDVDYMEGIVEGTIAHARRVALCQDDLMLDIARLPEFRERHIETPHTGVLIAVRVVLNAYWSTTGSGGPTSGVT